MVPIPHWLKAQDVAVNNFPRLPGPACTQAKQAARAFLAGEAEGRGGALREAKIMV